MMPGKVVVWDQLSGKCVHNLHVIDEGEEDEDVCLSEDWCELNGNIDDRIPANPVTRQFSSVSQHTARITGWQLHGIARQSSSFDLSQTLPPGRRCLNSNEDRQVHISSYTTLI